jgi:hypothetical protein
VHELWQKKKEKGGKNNKKKRKNHEKHAQVIMTLEAIMPALPPQRKRAQCRKTAMRKEREEEENLLFANRFRVHSLASRT